MTDAEIAAKEMLETARLLRLDGECGSVFEAIMWEHKARALLKETNDE